MHLRSDSVEKKPQRPALHLLCYWVGETSPREAMTVRLPQILFSEVYGRVLERVALLMQVLSREMREPIFSVRGQHGCWHGFWTGQEVLALEMMSHKNRNLLDQKLAGALALFLTQNEFANCAWMIGTSYENGTEHERKPQRAQLMVCEEVEGTLSYGLMETVMASLDEKRLTICPWPAFSFDI